MPDDKAAEELLSGKVAEIHAEAAVNHLNRLNIQNQDKEKALQKIIEIGA